MEEKILLKEILRFSDEEINNCKIRFIHTNDKKTNDVLNLFLNEPETINNNWLFWNYKKQGEFKEGQIAIALVRMDNNSDFYLLTTIKKITKDFNIKDGIGYEGIELEKYKKYYGRIIVKYHNTAQRLVRWASSVIDEIEVSQILTSVYEGKNFPGYDNVCLKYNELKAIIENNKMDWINALSNQKAVYLITDLYTGKLYVGKASSNEGMLLDRWKTYVKNGHGGNEELINLVKEKGFEYIKKNFQYSIIENYNAKIEDEVILERESYWKKVLDSRKHGLNWN